MSHQRKKSGLFTGLSNRIIRNELFRDEGADDDDDDDLNSHSFSTSRELSESNDVAMMLIPHAEVEVELSGNISPLERQKSIQLQRQQTIRRDHLRSLLRKKRVMRSYLKSTLTTQMNGFHGDDKAGGGMSNNDQDMMAESEHGDVPTPLVRGRSSATTGALRSFNPEDLFSKEELAKETEREKRMQEQQASFVKRFHIGAVEFPIEVRIQSLTYTVPVDPHSTKIPTVYNSSNIYHIYKFLQRLWRGESKPKPGKKKVLDDINLVLRPGKMYLVLGPPGSG